MRWRWRPGGSQGDVGRRDGWELVFLIGHAEMATAEDGRFEMVGCWSLSGQGEI